MIASFTSNAALITHNGYQLDTNTNIIQDIDNKTGLEWLRWDVTLTAHSIYDYLNGLGGYGGEGWQLATQVQAASLYETFFGTVDEDGNPIDNDENTRQDYSIATSATGTLNTAQNFIDLFGITGSFPEYTYSVGILADEDSDELYSYAIALDWGTYILPRLWYEGMDQYNELLENGRGLAFVRTTSNQSTDVPAPSALAIFAIGLLGATSRLFRSKKL